MASYRTYQVKKKIIDDDGPNIRARYTFPAREFFAYVQSPDGLTESLARDKVYIRCPFVDGGALSQSDARALTFNVQHYTKQRVEENLDQLGIDLKGKRSTIS